MSYFQFIDERLDLLNSGRGFSDEFEMECATYSEEMGRSSAQKIKQQYKDWAKTVKKEGGAFLKTVKDKVIYFCILLMLFGDGISNAMHSLFCNLLDPRTSFMAYCNIF